MALAVSGLRFDLNLVMVRPASENTLSEGAEVAGMHRIFLARLLISGNCLWPCPAVYGLDWPSWSRLA